MDPLGVLRDYTVRGALGEVETDGELIRFADRYAFSRNVPTGYKGRQGTLYDLDTLVFFAKHLSDKYVDYMKASREAKLEHISFLDRQDLIAYLTGQTDASDRIQLVAPDLHIPELPAASGMPEAEAAQPAAKRARLNNGSSYEYEGASGPEAAKAGDVPGKERQLRDRNSQLSVPGKSFERVLEILKVLQRDQVRRDQAAQAAARAAEKARPAFVPSVQSSRYDRHPDPIRSSSTGRPQPGVPPPPSSLPPSRSNANKHGHRSGGSHGKPSPVKKDPRQGGVPLILLPAAATARINMLNAKAFLEEGTYKSADQARIEGTKKETLLNIRRSIGRPKPVTYQVTDKTPDKASSDWRRIVAVFVTGATWQFKGWPFKGTDSGDMVDTFSRVMGTYVGLKDEVMPENVKHWNVKRYEVHPEVRHRDHAVVRSFFTDLDTFLSSMKCQLTY